MPRIRSEFHIRRDTATLGEGVDISTFDRVGKLGMDAKAFTAEATESAEFLFTEGGDADDTVVIAFFGGAGSQVQLKLSGSGSKGQHLAPGANGLIVGSATDSVDPLTEVEIGVALADWVDGDAVECQVYKI